MVSVLASRLGFQNGWLRGYCLIDAPFGRIVVTQKYLACLVRQDPVSKRVNGFGFSLSIGFLKRVVERIQSNTGYLGKLICVRVQAAELYLFTELLKALYIALMESLH